MTHQNETYPPKHPNCRCTLEPLERPVLVEQTAKHWKVWRAGGMAGLVLAGVVAGLGNGEQNAVTGIAVGLAIGAGAAYCRGIIGAWWHHG